jgi:hypothetical protein
MEFANNKLKHFCYIICRSKQMLCHQQKVPYIEESNLGDHLYKLKRAQGTSHRLKYICYFSEAYCQYTLFSSENKCSKKTRRIPLPNLLVLSVADF